MRSWVENKELTGALLISDWGWLTPAVVLVGLAVVVGGWSYVRGGVGGGVRVTCFLLKAAGIMALGICLLEPLWARQRVRPGANLFVVLADNSQGLQIKDAGAERSRGELLRGLLTSETTRWQSLLDENFQVRRYLFDSQFQATRDFREMGFEGRASSLGAALRATRQRFKAQPLAGVLVFTDGNATDLIEGEMDLAGLPPVYSVVIGKDDPVQDIALQKVTLSQTAFEDAPVSIQAEVSAHGYAGERIEARLVELVGATRFGRTNEPARTVDDRAGQKKGLERKVITAEVQRARATGEPLVFRFQSRPAAGGLTFYVVEAGLKEESRTGGTESREATLANNRRVLAVDRGRGPYRVLYVGGRPNWEYKFMQRALAEETQVQLVGLLRIAKREPKFEFRGRAGESSNPLFRGFDKKDEATERYDQPVLIRLNTVDENELRGGFPKTAEELFGYYAVVLDDIEAEFFTHDQMSLLQAFVSERGGGLLMLGGAESFRQGHYERTPIGALLPFYLDRNVPAASAAQWRLGITREGWLQPWVRLRSTELEERTRLDGMPAFQVLNRLKETKPGAMVLVEAVDGSGGKYPALAVHRFGLGRVAGLAVGDLWRWKLRDQKDDIGKAWRQLVRWLVADAPERIEFTARQKAGEFHQPVELDVRVRDKRFEPLDNATVTVRVRPILADGGPKSGQTAVLPVNLNAEPSVQEAGVYQSVYLERDSRGYVAEATVTDAAGQELGKAEAGWASDAAASEFQSLRPNRPLLERIARQTGGAVLEPEGLDDWAGRLPNRKAPITESWSQPAWHQPAVFLFALISFVTEWGIRRWKGLA